MSHWDRDLNMVDRGAGEYDVDVSGGWNAGSRPNGGYLMALGVRAVTRVAARPDPLTVTCHFLRPAEVGPARLRVEPVRFGRTVATLQAALTQGGRERYRLIATVGDLTTSTGHTRSLRTAPDLPPPHRCAPAPATLAAGVRLPITDRVELRLVPPSVRPGQPVEAAGWFRMRDGREPDPSMLYLVVDAFTPVVFALGVGEWSPTLELTVHLRARPAPGWLRVVRRTGALTNGWFEEDAEVWDSADVLVAQARQFARLGAGAATR